MTEQQPKRRWQQRLQDLFNWVRKPVHALIVLIVTAVIGAGGTWIWNWAETERTKHDPLAAYVESLLDRDDPPLLKPGETANVFDPRSDIIKLVVPDPHRLPHVLPPRPLMGGDCEELWRIGIDSGGEPPTSARYKIVFTNKYNGGDLSIIQLQARIHDRNPPSDGASLWCSNRGMGTTLDQPFACDLRTSDPAPCEMSVGSGGETATLKKVGRLTIAAGQQESSQISVSLPNDSID